MNPDDITNALKTLQDEIITSRSKTAVEIQQLNQQLNNQLNQQNQQLQQQNQLLLSETVALSRKMDEFNTRVEQLENRVDLIESQQDEHNTELDLVQKELNELRQKNLELNVLVSGMPECNDETQQQTSTIIAKLFKIVGFKAPSTAVTAVKRIGNKTGSQPRPILVTMDNVDHKEQILAAKRARKVTRSDI